MSIKPIGKIAQINRYPVKSFAGESVHSSKIDVYGVYGDRSHAFIDEAKDGWAKYVTARQIPDMLGYKARLIGEGSDSRFPTVSVESPDGRTLHWNEALLAEIQGYSERKLSMLDYTPGTPELLAVDTASILVITDESLRRLESLWGKRLDKRRFRANLFVSLGKNAHSEGTWTGKKLIIGSTELRVEMACERCSMIAMDPDSLELDMSLLKKVKEEMNLNFGVYASVEKTGLITVSDQVYLED